MKKALKIGVRILSLTALVTFVFSGSVVNKLLGTSSTEKKDAKLPPEGLFSAFEPTNALADAGGDGGSFSFSCGDCCGSN